MSEQRRKLEKMNKTGYLIAMCVGACGCGSDGGEPQLPETEHALELIEGHAVFGHEVRSLKPCGAEEAVWVIDSTGVLWEVHQELAPRVEPYEEVFVVVRGRSGEALTEGFGADYPSSFVVEELVYAAGEGFGCALDLDSIHYRASGNEPFWTVSISGAALELHRMGEESRNWGDVRLEYSDVGATYSVLEGGSEILAVTISDGPCRDTMSGAFFGYRATLSGAGASLSGCALRGAAEFAPER